MQLLAALMAISSLPAVQASAPRDLTEPKFLTGLLTGSVKAQSQTIKVRAVVQAGRDEMQAGQQDCRHPVPRPDSPDDARS